MDFINTSDKKFFSWMIACLWRAMSLDQDEETNYADFESECWDFESLRPHQL
jgi:hypothetical protein